MTCPSLMPRSLLRHGVAMLQRRPFWRGVTAQHASSAPQPAAAAGANMETLSVTETERLLFNGIKAVGSAAVPCNMIVLGSKLARGTPTGAGGCWGGCAYVNYAAHLRHPACVLA